MPSMHSPRGRRPSGDRPAFGTEISHFPKNPAWQSPFSRNLVPREVDLGTNFRLSVLVPEGWSDIGQKPESIKLALRSAQGDATLTIAAGELASTDTLEQIASRPFAALLEAGANSPMLTSCPVRTQQDYKGHLMGGPFMVPGPLLGSRAPMPVPFFKHIAVVCVGMHWFSFETEAWGAQLDVPLEVAAQTDLYLRVRVRH